MGIPYADTGLWIEIRRQVRRTLRAEWTWYVRRAGVAVRSGPAPSLDADVQAARIAAERAP